MRIIYAVLTLVVLAGCAGPGYNPTTPVSDPNAGGYHHHHRR